MKSNQAADMRAYCCPLPILRSLAQRVRIPVLVLSLALSGRGVDAQRSRTLATEASSSAIIRRAERELWPRIADLSEFDLRLPILGEPDEVIGPTMHAHDALAVASARVESLDSSIVERDAVFSNARYDLRIEDRAGNCLAVHQDVRIAPDSALVRGKRVTERCRPLYMADVVRRARRLAHLPLTAGRLDDNWGVAGAANGWADVYMDSVVITATTLALRASHPMPDTAAQRVDSVVIGLALGDGSWNIVRRSGIVIVDTTLRRDGEWRRAGIRFTIPIDSTFELRDSWPVLEVNLSVLKTEANPSGIAWTYSHATKPFFAGVRWPP
jgi:hypothetical protein